MPFHDHHFHPCLKATGVFIFDRELSISEDTMSRFVKIIFPFIMSSAIILGIMLLLHVDTAVAVAPPPIKQVINSGLGYLKANQQPNGGITGFSGTADPDTTARSVIAFVAAGQKPGEIVSGEGKSLLDYLATEAITFTHDTTGTLFPGRSGELLVAVAVAGENPKAFGGMDLVAQLVGSIHTDTGAYSTTAKQGYSSGAASDVSQAWIILGLSLSKQAVPEVAVQYLVKSQGTDGSWGSGDPDTTALVTTALLTSQKLDVKSPAIQKAIEYFHNTQAESAGWKPSWDTDPLNADSTGWIIQALTQAGEDLRGQSWTKNNVNPIDALLGLQKPDGSIGGSTANTYSTAEAIIGLAGIPLSQLGAAPVTHRAGLAIFSGDNSLVTACISYTESNLTGLQLLQRSGQPIVTATNPTQGTAVCKIGQVGDDSNNCFGSMPNYWSFWLLGNNGWEYSTKGADQTPVVDGGVYAWSWGTGATPAVLTFQNTCEGVAFVLPTTTVTSLPATSTAQPSQTPQPEVTTAPTPTSAPNTMTTSTGTYIVYAAVLVILVLVIVILMRLRRR